MIVFVTLGVVMMYIDGIEFLILVDHSMIVVFNDDDSIFLNREEDTKYSRGQIDLPIK